MKKSFTQISISSILILFVSIKVVAQNINMGSIVNFVAYTANGAISNTGTSSITGHVGTSLGIISGFDSNTMNGNIYNNNVTTDSAKKDLLSVYIHLQNIPVTNTTHGGNFGGEVIFSGVYSSLTAGSLSGALILDAQGNSNAIFIMKFEGAFSAVPGSNVTLINGAQSANVFWIAERAIDIGASVNMKGSVIAHPGSISFGANSNIDGRMLSTEGAISFNNGLAKIPFTISTIPIQCETSPCNNSILGSAANFTLFTSIGATSNAGSSGFIGNVGSHTGTVSGFSTSILLGTVENNNAVTLQAKNDLQSGYDQLMLFPVTSSAHAGVFGNGETVTPGVYDIASAGSIEANLTLDGLSNSDSKFIFRFAGALTTLAHSKVILINGARRCNIFWIAEGAISLGAFSFMKGNVIAHAAANNMASNGNLEGGLFSTASAVGFSTGVAYKSYSLCGGVSGLPLPISLTSFTGHCENKQVVLIWLTATEQNSQYFAVERSIDAIKWQVIDKVLAAGNSVTSHSYLYTDKTALKSGNYFYRLNCIDFDGNKKYGTIINVKKCSSEVEEEVFIYPTASSGIFNISYAVSKENAVLNNKIFNEEGELVFSFYGSQSKFDLTGKKPGVYFVKTQLKTKLITHKILILK